MSNYTKKNLSRFQTLAFLSVILVILAIVIWRDDHPEEDKGKYHNAGWSSLVLDLPPHTKDWKEWKGKTYCLLDDNEWHECEPRIVNDIPEGDK